MHIRFALWACTFCVFPMFALGQQISAPEPQTARVIGTVTDVQNDAIPGASVSVDGPSPENHAETTSNDNGFFVFNDLKPAVAYHVTIHVKGFADWTSQEIVLKPDQQLDLAAIPLKLSVVETTVAAVSSDQIALQQVQVEEKQRVFGVIPNFFVTYDANPAPLPAKLKYRLAIRTSTDVVTFAASAFLAGVNQAADTPDYVQGAKGYGQRLGAAYADGASNIMLGGAILPALLHQDPRYFYRGSGTTKSRVLHALASPFWCRNDDGHWEFNYSSVGGNLGSAALANLYYPASNRGAGLTFGNAAITISGQVVNTLVQEFILRRLTPSEKNKH
jgi:hypothetical protein